MSDLTNIVIAGLGGQGVLKACEIVASAAFRAGLDVKKAEVHGMSRRGGSVACDVRFGGRVPSPMVPPGEADFLVRFPPIRQRRTVGACGRAQRSLSPPTSPPPRFEKSAP